jgi:hypothetical protein
MFEEAAPRRAAPRRATKRAERCYETNTCLGPERSAQFHAHALCSARAKKKRIPNAIH